MTGRKNNFNEGKDLSNFVRPSSGRFVVNQKASIFGDRRTKRNRDRGTQKRRAIRDAQEE